MKGITIKDSRNNLLTFDLGNILSIIGEKADKSIWKVSGVECVGKSADILHKISDESVTISGDELFNISQNLSQIIEGEFEAFLDDERWLIIRAVDSSEYDVETDDLDVLNKVRQSFLNVKDMLE